MKILIVRLSSLGDIVLTQPVTAVLRSQYPDAVIDYLTKPQFKQIVESFQTIDTIHFWKDKKEVLKTIRNRKYDLIIDLHRKFNTFFIKLAAGGKKTITYRKYHLHRKLLTWHLTRKNNETTVNLYLRVLKKIGLEIKDVLPEIVPDSSCFDAVETVFTEKSIPRDKRLVAIFPGALHETKRYPTENIDAFLKLVPQEWNCHFLLLGSAGEGDLTGKLHKQNSSISTDLAGAFNLKQLIAVMAKADVIISNDSGPMHLAATLRKKQIALFGATHTSLGFAPQNPDASIMQLNLPCQPCSLHGDQRCPKGHFNCMKMIEAGELLRELRKYLR